MSYLPDREPVTALPAFEESELHPPLTRFDELRRFLTPVLGSQASPMIHGESYEQPDGATLFVAMSEAPLDAQAAANVLQRPLDDPRTWQAVQAGLRSVGLERRRITRTMRRAGRLDDLRDVSASAHALALVMNHTSQVRVRRADVEVLSYAASQRAADSNLRLISVQELARLMSIVLNRDMSAERLVQLKNWLRASRKRPDGTQAFNDFFERLRREMEEEGYDADTNDDIVDNLPPGDYNQLKDALWQLIFERFKIDNDSGGHIDMSGYVRSGEIPLGVEHGKNTTLGLGKLGVDLFLQFGGMRGEVEFRSPPRGWEIRPALVWSRSEDGERTLRFDTTSHQRDPETGNVVHYSPLVGAAALAAHFGERGVYTAALDRINPYVRQPKKGVAAAGRAGLLPLVLREGQKDLFVTPYMARLESKIEGEL